MANISAISPFSTENARIRSFIGSKWRIARKGLPHEVKKHAHVRGAHMRMLDPVTCACSTPSHAEGVGRVPREGISRSQPGPFPFPYWGSTRLAPGDTSVFSIGLHPVGIPDLTRLLLRARPDNAHLLRSPRLYVLPRENIWPCRVSEV